MSLNLFWVLAVGIGAFLIGLSKGGLGGTAVTLVTPLLALVMPAPDAVGVVLPLLIIGDCFALWVYWRCWDRHVVVRLLPGTIVGIAIGSILLGTLPAITIRHAIGIFALVFVAYKAWGRRMRQDLLHAEARPWYGSVFGGGCGLASSIANAGGPLADSYLLIRRLSPVSFMGTAALYFTLVNAMKIPGFLLADVLHPITFLQVAWAIPFVPLGVWVGKWMIRHLDISGFEIIVLVLLATAAIFLLSK